MTNQVTVTNQVTDIPKPLTKAQTSLAEAASINFWTFRNHVGKKVCTHTLHKTVQKEIIDRLAEDNDSVEGTRFIIDLFGPYQKKFKDLVIAPGAAIHTHSDLKSFSYREKDPTRIIYVHRALEFEKESDELIRKREAGLDEFLKDYDKYCQAGRDACDKNFPFLVSDPKRRGRMVKVSDLLPYPTKKEFRDAFYAYRSDFEPLNSFDQEKFAHLPAEFVRKHAAKHNAGLIKQMEYVKSQALTVVKTSMELLAKQLAEGKRLHESLLDKAKQASQALREISDGYSGEKGLIALADTIDERIVKHATAWGSFKENDEAKAKAARAAAAVSKKLGNLGKPVPITKPAAKPAVKAPAPKGKAAAGLLGRKRKATSK